jgi:hypothetical protein
MGAGAARGGQPVSSRGVYSALFAEVQGKFEIIDVVGHPMPAVTRGIRVRTYTAIDQLDAYAQAMQDLPWVGRKEGNEYGD